MKYISTRQNRSALLLTTILAVTLCASQSFANPFDDGTEHIVTTNTPYGSVLYVGSENPNNTLIVTSNSTVSAGSVIIGEYENSTNNLMSITGDSLLIAGNSDTNGLVTGGIVVGNSDVTAAITVDNASKLEGEFLYVGFGTTNSGRIDLAGDGTELNIAQDAYVGYAGSTNTLNIGIVIGSGSSMSVSNVLTVGSATASNNHVNVYGTLSVNSTNDIQVVEPEENDNGINVIIGGTLQVGGDVATETLAGLGVDMQDRSTLELGGELTLKENQLDSGYSVILNNDLSTNTATWSVGSGTFAHIGKTTAYNTLTLTNGATGSSSIGLRIGTEASAQNNLLSIGGGGSKFIAEKSVLVGGAGSNNKLNITDGGEMHVFEGLTLGKNSTATDNEVNVGSNGVLSVGSDVIVGANGESSTFTIDHGRVSVTNNFILGSESIGNRYSQTGGTNTVAGSFVLGQTEDANGVENGGDTTGNLATVGTNAILNIHQNLTVGQEGGGSIFNILDGGTVNVDGDAVIGEASRDNYIFLMPDNADTRFDVASNLVVGVEGGDNRFAVYGGTANIDGSLYLGASTNQHVDKNYIHLSSTNAVLNVAYALHIGASNSINTLNLHAGAKAYVQDLFVGAHDGVSNNVVTITGRDDQENFYVANSLLSVSNTLEIGSASGFNNAVNVKDGGTLFVLNPTNIVIGATATNELNNRLNINAGGTLHTIDWNYTTVSTNIVFHNGSTLELDSIFSGTNQLDGGFELALNGAPATTNWNTGTNVLHVGYETDGNTLTLQEGGLATTSTDLIVGKSPKSINNTLSVTGLSSRVEIGNNLIVGNKGSSNNRLEILGGGEIEVSNNLILGSASDGNRGLLEGFAGTNSTLNVMGNLTIGRKGDSNRLLISSNAIANIGGNMVVGAEAATDNTLDILGGGHVNVTNDFTLGSTSDRNTALLAGFAGTNSTLNVMGNLTIGRKGDSNGLLISSNAFVNVGDSMVVGVGEEATGNVLDILGDGRIIVTNDFILGSTSDSNEGLLAGFAETNSTLHVMGDLTVGLKGDGNDLQISSNAVVTIDGLATIGSGSDNNILRLTGSNAVLYVASNLVVGANASTGNELEITEGAAILNFDLVIGSHTNGDNNAVAVSGSNSTLNVGHDLIVGNIGARNALTIIDGATAIITNNAWIGLASAGNLIEAKGSNSSIFVFNDLYVGSTNEASSKNVLWAHESARISVVNNLFLANDGIIDIRDGAQIDVGGDYEQDELSTLLVRISTNSVNTNLVVTGTANFDENTTISVSSDGTISELVDEDGNTNKIERTIVAATTLKIADQDATTELLHSSINFELNALLDFNYTVTNNTILLDNFITRSWVEAAGLEGMLAEVGYEIEDMAAASNEFAQAMEATFQDGMTGQEINKAMEDYYGAKISSAPMHNVINQGIGSIASELTVRGDNTRDRATAPVPSGAPGPHRWNQQLQGWIAGYGTLGSKSEADGFDGYDSNLGGFIIGADLAVSHNILVGFAGGANSGSVDKDNGADGDTKTIYGAVYASAGTKDWFMDGSVIYGSSSIDNTLGDLFDTTASYDAKNLAFYIGGGKEFLGQYLIITPQASLLANHYEQDAYDEESTDAVARSVDGFDALYVQSSLGCNLGFYSSIGETTIKPELRAYWLHEFNANEEDVAYTLIGGTGGNYNMILQAPVADLLRLGAGVSAKLSEYLELRADLDTRLSADYSDYTVLGSLRYEF